MGNSCWRGLQENANSIQPKAVKQARDVNCAVRPFLEVRAFTERPVDPRLQLLRSKGRNRAYVWFA